MIGIVILNFNSSDYVKSAVESILNCNMSDFRIYVVDNFYNAQEGEKIRSLCDIDSRIEPIILSTNKGFSHGTNQGIKAALKYQCDYIHIFNPDVMVAANFYTEVSLLFENNPECAAATGIGYVGSPKDGCAKIWYNGGFISFLRGRGDCIDKFKAKKDVTISCDPFQTDFISCACVVVRSSYFEVNGLLDEDYCLGGEEWQLSIDIRKNAGFLLVTPNTMFFHEISVTHEKISQRLFYIGVRTKLLFVKKNLNNLRYYWWLSLYLVTLPVLILKFSLSSRQRFLGLFRTARIAVWDHLKGVPLSIDWATEVVKTARSLK